MAVWMVASALLLSAFVLPVNALALDRDRQAPNTIATDDRVVTRGDILIYPTPKADRSAKGSIAKVTSHLSSAAKPSLWPQGVIPYEIDPAIQPASRQQILDAIAHWNLTTPIRLTTRGAEDSFVAFTLADDGHSCSSAVGMISGRQEIRLVSTCTTGDIIHEIGHTVGLWHTQERPDRNRFVTVQYENIDRQFVSNFNRAESDGQAPSDPYDFNSIMHYGAYDFSKDSTSPTIETVPPGIPIGQRIGLSAGDIATVRRLYGVAPGSIKIATTPSGLQVKVDGAVVSDGTEFAWAPGSHHVVEGFETTGSGRVRHVFGSWSDRGERLHAVIAPLESPVLTANYIRQRQVTTVTSPSTAGVISVYPASPDGYYTERSSIQLTALPADGFHFLGWSLTPSTGANPKYVLVNQPLEIVASFTTLPVTTITSVPPGRSILVDGVTVSTPRNFAWTAGQTHSLSSRTTIEGSARYRFNGWEDGGDSARTITATPTGATFKALFSAQYRLTVESPIPVRLSPVSVDQYYDSGTDVRLAAETPALTTVVTWSGDLSGSLNPSVILVDGDKSVGLDLSNDGGTATTLVNAASLQEGPIAPGELVTTYKAGTDASLLLSPLATKGGTTQGGATMSFDGTPAQIILSSSGQVTAVVPLNASQHTVGQITVRWVDNTEGHAAYPIRVSAPGLFTVSGDAAGQVMAYNEDGTANSPANPARRASVIKLIATGIAPDAEDASVRIQGKPVKAKLELNPDSVAGAIQISIVVPADIRPGSNTPVYIVAGEEISGRNVTISIR